MCLAHTQIRFFAVGKYAHVDFVDATTAPKPAIGEQLESSGATGTFSAPTFEPITQDRSRYLGATSASKNDRGIVYLRKYRKCGHDDYYGNNLSLHLVTYIHELITQDRSLFPATTH